MSHQRESPSFKYSKQGNDSLDLNYAAIYSTTIISIVPFFILFFIPKNSLHKGPLLKILLSLAAGGLLADAFLYFIPNASKKIYDPSSNVKGHQNGLYLTILGGLLFFFLVDKFFRIIKSPQGEGERQIKGLKISGWLNLAGDSLHNCTNGLVIAASYGRSYQLGVSFTVSIMFHQIVHEFGDFAILIQSGSSKSKAMYCQLITALFTFGGTIAGLVWKTGNGSSTGWVEAFTAGGFIYIATVIVIPELLASCQTGGQSLKEILACFVSISLIFLLVQYEETRGREKREDEVHIFDEIYFVSKFMGEKISHHCMSVLGFVFLGGHSQ